MDPQTPNIFIPKKPVTSATVERKRLDSFVGAGIVVLSLVLVFWATAYVSNLFLLKHIQTEQDQISNAKLDLNSSSFASIFAVDSKITNVKNLLKNQTSLLSFFGFLEKDTLKRVSFTVINYNATSDKKGLIKISLGGTADSYGTLASQVNQYKQVEGVKTVDVTSIGLTDLGEVKFVMDIGVDPSTDLVKPQID